MFSAQLADSLAESAGEVEGAETNAGQRVSRVARAGAAGIIAQYGVEHVEAAILDVPATTQVFQQERGIGLVTRQAGDRVGHALPSLSFLDGVAFQPNDLLRAGPVEVLLVDETRRRRDGASFQTPAALLDRGRGWQFLVSFTDGKR